MPISNTVSQCLCCFTLQDMLLLQFTTKTHGVTAAGLPKLQLAYDTMYMLAVTTIYFL